MWWPLVILLCLLIVQTYVIWRVYGKTRLEAPQKVSILDIKEDTISTYLYKFGLPVLGADDVVKREFHVVIEGGDTVHEITDVANFEFELGGFVEDQHVAVFLVDIDDAGNRSPDGETLEFDVVDLVAPLAPGAPTILNIQVEN